MTLDGTIALLEKMAEKNEEKASLLERSGRVGRKYWEHAAKLRVVACWLMELKIYRIDYRMNKEVTEWLRE